MKQPSQETPTRVRRTSKVRPVLISQMRVPPVHVTQRPFRPSWGKQLAANLDLNELGYPVINYRDGIYWIIDGQHRIFAMKENDFEKYEIDCEVFENLEDKEVANIFLGRNNSRSVAPFDKFQVACTAEDPRACSIRRAVETQGVKISRSADEGCISAVSSLGKVFDEAGGGQVGEVILGQVVRTINVAYGGDRSAFDSNLIEGLGSLFNRFNGRTNEKQLTIALSNSQHGARGLLRRAEAQRQKTGNRKTQCVAAAVVDAYNKQAPRATRLPSWWKDYEG